MDMALMLANYTDAAHPKGVRLVERSGVRVAQSAPARPVALRDATAEPRRRRAEH
jgi:hypothetical protein